MKFSCYLFCLFTVAATSLTKRAPQVYHLQISAAGAPEDGKLIQQLVGVSSVHTTFVLGYFPDSQSNGLTSLYNFTLEPSPIQAPTGQAPNHLLKKYPDEDTSYDFLANLIGGSDGGTDWFEVYSTALLTISLPRQPKCGNAGNFYLAILERSFLESWIRLVLGICAAWARFRPQLTRI